MKSAGKIYISKYITPSYGITNNIYAGVKGRMFDNWIEQYLGMVTSVNTTSNIFTTSIPHNLLNNQVIRIRINEGTLPAPLDVDTSYYVIYVSLTTFKLSTTYSGSEIDITTTGSGTEPLIMRYNGNNPNDLIQTSPYTIESLIRDELLKEINLTIEAIDGSSFICTNVLHREDNYYDNATILNRTTGNKYTVTTYSSVNSSFQCNGTVGTVGDTIEISNINGNKKINVYDFDYCGNTTNGYRKDWKIDASIHRLTNFDDLISDLLFESHSMLFTSNGKYKISPLSSVSDTSTLTTLTSSVNQNGKPAVISRLTDMQDIFNSFTLRYKFDFGSNEHKKIISVNRTGASPGLTLIGNEYVNLCNYSVKEYRFEQTFDYGCSFIYDDETAELFLIELIKLFTKRKLLVSWIEKVQTGILYEVGDQVKLDCPRKIPESMRDNTPFIITGKNLVTLNSAPYIMFKLMEVS